MRNLLGALSAVALALGAVTANADQISKATPQGYSSGGLAGANVGCLYLTTDEGLFTLPFNLSPNTAQLVAVDTLKHPTFGSVSFLTGGANPALCPLKGWESALMIMGQVSSP